MTRSALAAIARRLSDDQAAEAHCDASQGFDLGVDERLDVARDLSIVADALEGSDLYTAEEIEDSLEEIEFSSVLEAADLVAAARAILL